MRIKQARLKAGLTQAQLAKKLKVTRVHLANLESPDSAKHHRSPSLSLLERLSKAVGVSVTDLLE